MTEYYTIKYSEIGGMLLWLDGAALGWPDFIIGGT